MRRRRRRRRRSSSRRGAACLFLSLFFFVPVREPLHESQRPRALAGSVPRGQGRHGGGPSLVERGQELREQGGVLEGLVAVAVAVAAAAAAAAGAVFDMNTGNGAVAPAARRSTNNRILSSSASKTRRRRRSGSKQSPKRSSRVAEAAEGGVASMCNRRQSR